MIEPPYGESWMKDPSWYGKVDEFPFYALTKKTPDSVLDEYREWVRAFAYDDSSKNEAEASLEKARKYLINPRQL